MQPVSPRGKRKKVLSFKLEPDLIEEITDFSKKMNMTTSEFLRMIVLDFLRAPRPNVLEAIREKRIREQVGGSLLSVK